MAYSEKVLDHYENPRNVGVLDAASKTVGTGMVGAPACGDVMRLQIKIDDDGIIPTMGSDSPFSDDIVARSKEFIQMVWGDGSLTENLNFINEALGENIEKYLT